MCCGFIPVLGLFLGAGLNPHPGSSSPLIPLQRGKLMEGYVEKVGKCFRSKTKELYFSKQKSPKKAKTLRNLIPDEAELVRIINFHRFLIGE
jgi:hypothetical protein